jgi:crossover junction endodeoxyribonuclease RusA
LTTITLPWPPVELNPNSRVHYQALARATKAYREACGWCVREHGIFTDLPIPLPMVLEFYPPDRREYDRDNLLARFKAGMDGLADGLKIDDKHFVPTIRLMPNIGGMVKVILGTS